MEQKYIYNKFLEMLKKDLSILPDKQEENAANTLSALWHTAAGNRVSPIASEKLALPELLPHQIKIAEELIQSRLSGVPLAHLTQRQDFMGLDYILNKGHYIPRKETELLAKTAIDIITDNFVNEKKINAIDLCTGIGTVALAIAHYCKNAIVFGSDIYSPAIEAAKINAKHFSLDNRATFFNDNMFTPFESLSLKDNTSIIVSAPPYISSSKVKNMAEEIAAHEPEEAFDAGPFGLSIFTILIAAAPEYLTVNGYLIFECGLGQGDFLAKRIDANGNYGVVDKICDENGNVRVLKAKKII
jgi:release factor glutamine methyltransferase